MNICLRPLSMQRSYYGRPKTITLAKTWPNETGYVTQRNTWHCEKLRDVALTNLTQRNTWMKRDARKSAAWSSENGTFRGENTLRYDSQWHCEKLRDVAHSNVTQRNIWKDKRFLTIHIERIFYWTVITLPNIVLYFSRKVHNFS